MQQQRIRDTTAYSTMPSFRDKEMYPPHLLAQKLNNRASFLITIKDYDGGIELLTKALQLTERNLAVDQKKQQCLRKCCRLEASLTMDRQSFSSIMESERKGCISDKYSERCRPSIPSSACGAHTERDQVYNCFECHHQLQNSFAESPIVDERGVGFVFDRPFLVNPHSIEEGHFMGITLSLIILFNLSLAHHLKAVSSVTVKSKSKMLESLSHSNMHVLQQALQLYELAYQLHTDCVRKLQIQSADSVQSEEHNRNIGSLRFTMIISNNLGEIHRVVGNFAKHKMCLEHLLSSIMYMVDCNVEVMDSAEMDGFYHNVSPIMLNGYCAKAA
mmetsp:Transcript_10993/g.25994  ORF Transcript_10993/g.25994 Transcript_10993/m.25994 type:complete len:331 (-) Transcript_10993:231-1223(-)